MLNGDAHHSNKRTGELSIRFVELSMTERHSIPDSACFDNGLTISCFMPKTTSTTAAYYNKGLGCLKLGDFAEAITQLKSAAEPYWGDGDTLAALCLAIDEAEAKDSTFDASMAKLWSLPDGAAFQRALAIDSYRCGLYLDAIVYALRSVLIAPDDVISIYVLARSYLAAGLYEEAKTSFRRALELEPDFRIARSRLNSL
jgi:tetratricopeptide (TPR) repeat protein